MLDNNIHSVAAIIPAAGVGTRMGADIPKQFLELAGEPVLVRTLRVFLAHPAIDLIMLILPPLHLETGKDQLIPFLSKEEQSRIMYVAGGDTRQHSVQNGIKALPASIERIFVHDGARPLVKGEIIDRCLAGIEEHGAVIAAVPVKDTLKEVEEVEGGIEIIGTVDRSQLWQAQTPQAMDLHLLERAYEYAEATEFIGTDESSLLEHAGVSVSVVMGSEENIKITRPEDLRIAATLLRENQEGETAMRIGHGFDAHRLVEGRKLILGGVEIPYALGLAGHSDADVLVHALMDALLGALGAGDIGRHFPDTDEQYRGADSLKLLERVMGLVRTKKMHLGNADITVVCQQPKLAPYLETMQKNLAAVCGVTTEQVNIKATTTEEMGYTGRGEGITAHAVVLLTETV
ncbi:MAG: 2-C-methyl-D-erythritol 4-phosphate cytidylyltransferase [Candidatus Electrothrix sp. Rat3]|nr:2-C-methyl-D-erythritol 4-phosphate cytidylyltransferase [Candidatus Electrothrix rattekaaiensis]